MGLLRGLTKAGLVKKAIDEARRPENQVKIKRLAAKLAASRGSRRNVTG